MSQMETCWLLVGAERPCGAARPALPPSIFAVEEILILRYSFGDLDLWAGMESMRNHDDRRSCCIELAALCSGPWWLNLLAVAPSSSSLLAPHRSSGGAAVFLLVGGCGARKSS